MPADAAPLRILQCLRAPVGGLFRHVCDLTEGLAARGHYVGLICDSQSGGTLAIDRLARLAPHCAFGITRLPMHRLPGPSDITAVRRLRRLAGELDVDVIHGHGAKGGAHARLAFGAGGHKRPVTFYTPHGGALHYEAASLSGRLFLGMERALLKRSGGLIFESQYSSDVFGQKVAVPTGAARVIHNGLHEDEFTPVATAANAQDILFIGEMRVLKGVGTLLEALALLARQERPFRALLIGDGPDKQAFQAQAEALGLQDRVTFGPAMPAHQAFSRGRIMVVPSHAESLPYIVLEAAAAGRPLLATNVGGMAEIFGEQAYMLLPPRNPVVLADQLAAALADPPRMQEHADWLRQQVQQVFSLDGMINAIEQFYYEIVNSAG